MGRIFGDYNRPLFWGTFTVIALISVMAMGFTEAFGNFWFKTQALVYDGFGWLYMLTVAVTLVFCLILACTRVGDLKLGRDDEKPAYSTFSWVAMMISAGIACGAYFWSVAEPLQHYLSTPYLAESGTPQAMSISLAIVFMHYGVHGWAVFALVGLAVGYASYRLKQPLFYAASFYGLLGKGIHGPLGQVVNFLCAVLTVAGVATSMGMGVLSISYVVGQLFGINGGVWTNVLVMTGVALIYIGSTAAGLERGMARLSGLNIYIAAFMMAFVFIFGPTQFILRLFNDSLGAYLQYMPFMSLWSDAPRLTGDWPSWWTQFYWAWWLAWAPFIGGFIARISRGRTVRQLILGGVFLPSIVCFAWFTIMGGTGMDLHNQGLTALWESIQRQNESGYFLMLTQLPWPQLTSLVALISLVLFLATSADAGSLYVAIVLSKGQSRPALGLKLFCALMIAVLPIAMIFAGGLKALQTMSLIMAVPLAFGILLTIVSVIRMVQNDPDVPTQPAGEARKPAHD